VERQSGARGWSILWRLALAVLAGFVVNLLLFAASADELPSSKVCYSLIGYEVPCGNQHYVAAVATTCVVAGLLLVSSARRSKHQPDPSEAPPGASTDAPPTGDSTPQAPR
jgi:hypothetical protein